MIEVCENWLKNSLSNYILWKNSNNITISFANLYVGVIDILKNEIPYGKVAIILSKNSYLEHGESLSQELKKAQHRVVTLILDDGTLNEQNVNKLFSLPEDVRAIITIDNEFFDVARYYSYFNNIILVAVYTKLDFNDCFKKAIYFNDKGIIRRYDLEYNTRYVFDVSKITESPSKITWYICEYCSKILAPIDYRLNLLLNDEDEKVVELKLIYSTVNRIIEKLKEHPIKIDLELFLLTLRMEILNGMTNGKLFDCFSAKIASSALDEKDIENNEMQLRFSLIFCRLYQAALRGEFDDEIVGCYSKRVDLVERFYRVSKKNVTGDYLNIIKRAKSISLSSEFKSEILSYLQKADRMLNNALLVLYSYKEKAQEITRHHLNVGLLAGDLPKRANGLTFIRENVF